MFEIKHEYFTGPVTALHVIEPFVLAGIGSYLNVYDVNKHCCVQSMEVLPCRNIHGIRQSQDENINFLCVYGEKCIRIVDLDTSNLSITFHGQLLELEDWILDVTWLDHKDGIDDHIAVITSHNVILKIDRRQQNVLQRIPCVENCILYSAKFIGQTWDNLVLAAGTVFNQVLLWSPHGQVIDDKLSVMHRLTGHQGVIFSIDFHLGRCQLCSVSDDRSIRVWQLEFTNNDCSLDSDIKEISLENWTHCKSSVHHVLYGHSARVWMARMLTTSIISVGEDSTCCVWNLEGKIVQKFKGHKGKSIWSLTVDKYETMVVTGGGDSSIRVWMLESSSQEEKMKQSFQSLDQPYQADDFPRSVTMLNFDNILVVTNTGLLLQYNFQSKNWTTIMDDTEFSSYTVLAVSKDRMTPLVAIGNIYGKLKIFYSALSDLDEACASNTWQEFGLQIYTGKVFSIKWLCDDHMLTSGPDGCMIMWKVRITSNGINVEEMDRYHLPLCKQRWVSAATLTRDHQKLICGDRGGSVHLYSTVLDEDRQVHDTELDEDRQLHDAELDGGKEAQSTVLDEDRKVHDAVLDEDRLVLETVLDEERQMESRPTQMFPIIHGKAGVTDVCFHGDHVYTAGRDGHYRQYSMEDDQLVLLNSSRVYKGFEWIDRLTFREEDGDSLIYGFHGSDFVLWSVNSNQKLLQIPCGGGHRTWDCCIHDNSVRFIYLKTKELVLCDTILQNNQIILKESLHGREITDVKFVVSFMKDTSNYVHVIATCSEDTAVQISMLFYNENNIMDMTMLQKLQGHISSVRTLAVCESGYQQGNINRKLLFSAGGRAQLVVWRLSLSSVEHSVSSRQNVSCSHESLCNFMLGHVKRKKHARPWRLRNYYTNPETRFMDLAVVNDREISSSGTGYIHFLIAACSDGFVRFYCFKELSRELTLIKESEFHDHCVLKVQYFVLSSTDTTTNTKHLIFLSAGTDGRIAFWDMTPFCLRYISEVSEIPTGSDMDTVETSFKEKMSSSKGETNLDTSDKRQHISDGRNTNFGSSKLNTDNKEDLNIDPDFVLNLHQSGINSMDVYKMSDFKYLIGSGGDDNCLKISLVSVATENSSPVFTLVKSGHISSAHSAQITCLKLLYCDKCLTVSIDQRACIWNITETSDGLQLEMLCCKFVNVADLANIDVYTGDRGDIRILLGGVGLGMSSVTEETSEYYLVVLALGCHLSQRRHQNITWWCWPWGVICHRGDIRVLLGGVGLGELSVTGQTSSQEIS